MTECVICVVCQAGKHDDHIQSPPPRIAEGVAPVEEGCRPDRGGNGCEMGGGGVDVGIYRGGDRQPGEIPDEVRLREWEGEGVCGGALIDNLFICFYL